MVLLCVIQGMDYCVCLMLACKAGCQPECCGCHISSLGLIIFADGAARAGLAQLADTFVSDPRRHFAEGQSVRAAVAAVDSARGRFALSLKPSLVAAPDGVYLGSLFRDLEFAERMRCAPRTEGTDSFWAHRDKIIGAVALEWGALGPSGEGLGF